MSLLVSPTLECKDLEDLKSSGALELHVDINYRQLETDVVDSG